MAASSPSPSRSPGGASIASRTAAWTVRAGATPPAVAVVLMGHCDVQAAVRGYRTMLPRAEIFLYGVDLPDAMVSAATASGATVRPVLSVGRTALVRRIFAEIDADIYILAQSPDVADVVVAPLLVAEIDGADRDFVTVSHMASDPASDLGNRVLGHVVDLLYGHGGDALGSRIVACSRRFARSYGGGDLDAGRDLLLHALRLRMPVGSVAALGHRPESNAAPPIHSLAERWALLCLVVRLFVEERPRRVFGLIGLAIVAAGVAGALPVLRIHDWHATLQDRPLRPVSMGLAAAGVAVGVAGLLLDSLAKARQEVKRLGYLAIPRRIEPPERL